MAFAGGNVKRLTQLFTTLTTRDRRKGVATDPIAARKNGRKEIRAEKTGLAAGNNFPIDHVASQGPASVANPDPNAYLAINWQQADIEARFTFEDRRFPTPPQPRNNGGLDALVTTNHLLLPSQRGKAAFLLPISQPNSTFLARKRTDSAEGGGGGSQTQVAESPVSMSSHGNFLLNGLPCSVWCFKKRRSSNGRTQNGSTLEQCPKITGAE